MLWPAKCPISSAVYLSRQDRSRSWRDTRLQHDAVFLDETEDAREELIARDEHGRPCGVFGLFVRLGTSCDATPRSGGQAVVLLGGAAGYRGLGPAGPDVAPHPSRPTPPQSSSADLGYRQLGR